MWAQSIVLAILFIITAHPALFKAVRKVLGAWVASADGLATPAGLLLHGALLVLLAAGLAGQMARFLIQADLLPALAEPLWDTSALLSTSSLTGSILHVLVGYESSPSGMQMLFYVGTVSVILFLAALVKRQHSQQALKPSQA